MSDVIEQTMGKVAYIKEPTYEDYVDTDAEARRVALSLCHLNGSWQRIMLIINYKIVNS